MSNPLQETEDALQVLLHNKEQIQAQSRAIADQDAAYFAACAERGEQPDWSLLEPVLLTGLHSAEEPDADDITDATREDRHDQ